MKRTLIAAAFALTTAEANENNTDLMIATTTGNTAQVQSLIGASSSTSSLSHWAPGSAKKSKAAARSASFRAWRVLLTPFCPGPST